MRVRQVRLGGGPGSQVTLPVQVRKVVESDAQQRVVAQHLQGRQPQIESKPARLAQRVQPFWQDAGDRQPTHADQRNSR